MRNTVTRVAQCVAFLAALALGFTAGNGGDETATRILDAARSDSTAWDKLAYLSDRVGHRLSGSEQLDRAVAWVAAELERDGVPEVWTEPVMVPRWIRGDERARITSPVVSELALLALGGTVGTSPGGLEAEVVEVDGFETLERLGDSVAGKIVLFNRAIEAGFGSENGYGSAVGLRARGASRAAQQGAVGMLIRSLGTADYRLPHTGSMGYEDDVPRIPGAAIAAEDAELIHRLLASGDTVRVHLELGSHTLPDVESANVIAEIPGRELPQEIVLIGAHLDTWDVGQGAHDDGAGCAAVMETMRLLRRLELQPRRTIRAVLFTNEENGLRGGKDYAARHGAEFHEAAIESDSGGAAPIGFGITGGPGGVEIIESIAGHLRRIDAAQVFPRGGGADISPLKEFGVPRLALVQDSQHYFDYHHTEADTLDKIDPRALERNVAALAWMAYALAEREGSLPRAEIEAEAAPGR